MKKIINYSNIIFSKHLQKKFILVCLLSIFNSLLESLSIYLFVPLTKLITDSTYKVPLLNNFELYNKLNLFNAVIFYLSLLTFIFLIKAFFSYHYTKIFNKFVFESQSYISEKLFHNYLFRDYSFHLYSNTTELITNCSIEVNTFIGNVLMPLMTLISEILIVFFVLSLLFVFEPLSTFILTAFLIFFGYLFLRKFKNKSKKFGIRRQELETIKNSLINQGLRGIKDLIVSNKREHLLAQFRKFNVESTTIGSNQNVFLNLMKIISEPLIALLLLILVISWSLMGKEISGLIVFFTFLILAIYRTLPSIFKIINSVQSINFGFSSFNLILNELSTNFKDENYDNNCTLKLENNYKIIFEKVNFKYPNNDNLILNNFNLVIKKSDKILILGKSGSGKTTFLSLILGLLKPISGNILINNVLFDKNLSFIRSKIGYVSQNVYLSNSTILDNIIMGDKNCDYELLNKVICVSDLNLLIDSLPNGINTELSEGGINLSGGQVQRIGIARALYSQPEIIVLDEFTSALDINTENLILKNIMHNYADKTVILVTHKKNVNYIDNLEIIFGDEIIVNRK